MKKINAIADYVKDGIESGAMKVAEAMKGASITAVQGIPGQIVKTYTRSEDGSDFYETKNVVKNGNNGQPGWIVTNPDGEKYIVDDEQFREKYDKADDGSNSYRPKGKPVLVAGVKEDIAFTAPWGEEMNIKAGGVLVLAGKNDIYGIQGPAFAKTYSITENPSPETEARARALLEMPERTRRPSLAERMAAAAAKSAQQNNDAPVAGRNDRDMTI